jgi:chromatin segregation and condensation protein Rec8/ScpA/Scc1 (kleisin family)
MASLELSREGAIALAQTKSFGEIQIAPVRASHSARHCAAT